MDFSEILLIHLGGLGDLCLSESTFYSLSRRFRENLVGLGTKRLLTLFEAYFARIHGIESARWLYLFSERPTDVTWERIVFIGKDREGNLRERWQRFSRAPLIFIEMYPEETPGNPVHAEDHQLAQLGAYGIEPLRKEIEPRSGRRVILYPEKGFRKEKWAEENFVALYSELKGKGVETVVLEPSDVRLDLPESTSIPDLRDVRAFFSNGGIFVSNDSGMAHLAGMCGLATLTIFTGFDPAVWHPRGSNRALRRGIDPIDPASVAKIITDHLSLS